MTGEDETLVYVQVPRQILLDFAAACRAGHLTRGPDDQGVYWYWAPGAPQEDRMAVTDPDDSGDVLVRFSSGGTSSMITWTSEEWDGFLRRL